MATTKEHHPLNHFPWEQPALRGKEYSWQHFRRGPTCSNTLLFILDAPFQSSEILEDFELMHLLDVSFLSVGAV